MDDATASRRDRLSGEVTLEGGDCEEAPGMVLRPPVEPMLAQAAESVSGPAALRAGVAYEQKLDGHRALVFTAAGPGE